MTDTNFPPPVASADTVLPPPPPAFWTRPAFWLNLALEVLLLALVVTGVVFRFSWVDWNQGTDLHPDEYGLTGTLSRMSVPKTLAEYFNTRLSPISPYNRYDEAGNVNGDGPDNGMSWGQWPQIIIRWTAETLTRLGKDRAAEGGQDFTDYTAYNNLRLLGRRLSALADTLALIVIFLIGNRLYGRRVGLLAAALSALAAMQIQASHFMTVDNYGVLFSTLSMYAAVGWAQTPVEPRRPRTWLWPVFFGVVFGMALASRINLLPLGGMALISAFIANFKAWRKGDLTQVPTVVFQVAVLVLVGGLTFRVTHPSAFRAVRGDTTFFTLTPNPDWVRNMAASQALNSGEVSGGPPGEQWTNRTPLLFPFLNIVLWGLGLPLGIMGWAGLGWAGWRIFKAKRLDEWLVHLLPFIWVVGYFGFMGTRWVMAMRYFLPIYPFLALFAAWAIVEVWRCAAGRPAGADADSETEADPELDELEMESAPARPLWRYVAGVLFGVVVGGTFLWAWGYTGIYRRENTRVQATRWMFQNVPAALNVQYATAAGAYQQPLMTYGNVTVPADGPYTTQFSAPITGTLAAFSVAHVTNANGQPIAGLLHVVLSTDPDGQQPLAVFDLPVAATSADPRGDPARAEANAAAPVELSKGTTYYLRLTAPQGGPLAVTTTTTAGEHWDEWVPVRWQGLDAGVYQGLNLEVRGADDERKRQMYLDALNRTDYIVLPSQRGVWSAPRLPNTYPLTLKYYAALFSGELGFEQVAGSPFNSPFEFGPLQISDVGGTVAWGRKPDLPLFNFNLTAAEEAFSIYDHAPVWIFRKTAAYDPAKAQSILSADLLTKVVNQEPRSATIAPTLLMLPPDLLALQRAGGTWSEMFDAASLLNRFEPLGVIVWWGVVVLLGLLAFPLTFVALPGLPDRGYPFSKVVALLLVTWLVWITGSLRWLPFTRLTIWLALGLVAVLSALVFWRRQAEIGAYVRREWRYLLVVEGLFTALFVFDLLIRWGNPDLWHPNFGGEKPMVLSFFNAVLKSTYFPPYDPWLAGGYINYYYYGFVIVGVLTKLVGIVPTFAYNLILPTWFALLGTGAFCVAYNLVRRSKEAQTGAAAEADPASASTAPPAASLPEALPQPQAPLSEAGVSDLDLYDDAEQGEPVAGGDVGQPASAPAPVVPPAPAPKQRQLNPYLAGLAATLLVVVLGNLAQVGVVAYGFQRTSDKPPQSITEVSLVETLKGMARVLIGDRELSVGVGNWYWDATRIVAAFTGGSEINEFPFFTFLYADMHAHMLDMPLAMLAIGWAVAYWLGIDRKPGWLENLAIWGLGGLVLGVTRVTNTWDFPTYLGVGVAAVAAAHWLKDPRPSRQNFFAIGWRVLLLAGLALLFYRPFDEWFASPLTKLEQFKGTPTPLVPYLATYGLFLFILVTWLAYETWQWMSATPAALLSRWREWGLGAAAIGTAFVACLGALIYWHVAVGVVALPVMAWAGMLLIQPRASLVKEKRVPLFLLGTALALTVFVEAFAIGGDRMNTIFKLYIQAWLLLSVAAGAGLAWIWASLPRWNGLAHVAWVTVLGVLVSCAALYTVTATAAKVRDRFYVHTADPVDSPAGCRQLAEIPMPTTNYPDGHSLPIEAQPHTLDGMAYMQWSAYCDRAFLPLVYDYEAIRWMQANIEGSPVIAEAQSFDLYHMSTRYAWYTGLPNVVGWDWHQRQERGAAPTEFITQRGNEITNFYMTLSTSEAKAFLQKYDVRYIIIGTMELAYYRDSGGLRKFVELAQQGYLTQVYPTPAAPNPAVTIYAVTGN